ncbi:GNAT family N-acetyltransferase [Nocardiopsis kunsanensis]|nr:GNAT family N-acetyltransferase [Nocardiopsis kunsanensis]
MSVTVTASARPTTIDDVPSVARVLSRATHGDPLFQWLFPETRTRLARIRRFHAMAAGFGYVPYGDVRVTEAAESTAGESVVRAAALWAPAESNPEGPLVSPRLWPHWGPLLGRGRVAPFVRVFAEWKLAAPQEPHLYLAALGVDPVVAGTGIGGALLSQGLDRADAEGMPVFTQTMNDKALGFYERFGFEVVREVDHLEGGITHFLQRG